MVKWDASSQCSSHADGDDREIAAGVHTPLYISEIISYRKLLNKKSIKLRQLNRLSFEVFSLFFCKMFSINLIIIMMLFRFLSSENENESI